MNGQTQLIHWYMKKRQDGVFQDLVAPKLNLRPERIHELAVDDEDQLLLGENDNLNRSSYLWAVWLDKQISTYSGNCTS